MKIYIKGVSPRYATKLPTLPHRSGQAARSSASWSIPGGSHRLVWKGLVDGKPLDPGTYLVQSEVRDTAGNVGDHARPSSRSAPSAAVRASPCAGSPRGRRCGRSPRAGGPSSRSTRAARRTAGACAGLGDSAVRKRGRETKNVLAFRAPTGPSGVYLLELRAGRWHTTVPFLVQAEKRSSVLVVVPTITWLGTDKVDDRPFDGLPNTLANGGTVRWPRVFVGEDGLPAGFARRHRAAARLPRPPPHPVRPHE